MSIDYSLIFCGVLLCVLSIHTLYCIKKLFEKPYKDWIENVAIVIGERDYRLDEVGLDDLGAKELKIQYNAEGKTYIKYVFRPKWYLESEQSLYIKYNPKHPGLFVEINELKEEYWSVNKYTLTMYIIIFCLYFISAIVVFAALIK